MSEPAPDPPRSLEDLLQAWIDTETWKASHDFLATYAGQLLSDDALHTLDAMIAQGGSKQDEADDRESASGSRPSYNSIALFWRRRGIARLMRLMLICSSLKHFRRN